MFLSRYKFSPPSAAVVFILWLLRLCGFDLLLLGFFGRGEGGAGAGFALLDIGEIVGVAVGGFFLAGKLDLLPGCVTLGDETLGFGAILFPGVGGNVVGAEFLEAVGGVAGERAMECSDGALLRCGGAACRRCCSIFRWLSVS